MRSSMIVSALVALSSFAFAAPVSTAESTLEARAAKQSCRKSSDCRVAIPKNSYKVCGKDRKCGFACSKGYTWKNKRCEKNGGSSSGGSKSSGSGSNSGVVLASGKTTYSGQATWYTQDGNAGSCGNYHGDYDMIVAMNTPQVANGAHCGQHVTITNTANGKSVRCLVQDECPGCGYGSLDLSLGAFKAIGDLDTGVLPIKWQYS